MKLRVLAVALAFAVARLAFAPGCGPKIDFKTAVEVVSNPGVANVSFKGSEVHAAPFELEPNRRLSGRHSSHDEGLYSRRELDGLEEPSADAGLEVELPPPLPGDPEARPLSPPLVALRGEAVERDLGRDGDEDGRRGRVSRRSLATRLAHRRAFPLPRVRSTWSRMAESSRVQNFSTSSTQVRSARNGSGWRR